ncbi:MAG: hypothetical protein N2544_06755 [Burkholderiales bacterium]|nr:hypothetical protein [Burkholderiales bacterium]
MRRAIGKPADIPPDADLGRLVRAAVAALLAVALLAFATAPDARAAIGVEPVMAGFADAIATVGAWVSAAFVAWGAKLVAGAEINPPARRPARDPAPLPTGH